MIIIIILTIIIITIIIVIIIITIATIIIITSVSKSFILVTSILFKSLANPGFGNSIQFVIFSFFEFSSGGKVASFVLKFFYHAKREEVEGSQAHGWVPDIPLSPLRGISKSLEDQSVVVWRTPLTIFC